MNSGKAERILARVWIESAVDRFAEDGWEANPDIGQYSYERIVDWMTELVRNELPRSLVEEAYTFLSDAALVEGNE